MVIARDILSRLMAYHCLFEPEAELADLVATFAATRARAFLEIGTYKGFTSAAIAFAFPQARVVTVDLPDPTRTPWNPLPRSLVGEAYRALGMADRVEQWFMDSSELWRFAGRGEIYDLIFIDGDHSPDAVFRDLILAADLLSREGGVLLAHDYTDPHEPARPAWTIGVQQAVDRFLRVRPFRKRRLKGLLVALERQGLVADRLTNEPTKAYSQCGEQSIIADILKTSGSIRARLWTLGRAMAGVCRTAAA